MIVSSDYGRSTMPQRSCYNLARIDRRSVNCPKKQIFALKQSVLSIEEQAGKHFPLAHPQMQGEEFTGLGGTIDQPPLSERLSRTPLSHLECGKQRRNLRRAEAPLREKPAWLQAEHASKAIASFE